VSLKAGPDSRETRTNRVLCSSFLDLTQAVTAEILDRLGSSADHWEARLDKLRQGRLLGRFFATSRKRFREVAERLGLRRVPNPAGCAAT